MELLTKYFKKELESSKENLFNLLFKKLEVYVFLNLKK